MDNRLPPSTRKDTAITDEPQRIGDALRAWFEAISDPSFDQPIWSNDGPQERSPLPRTLSVAVLLRDWFGCRSCGQRAAYMNVDHIVPVAGGGSNLSTNLQALCAKCNEDKSNRRTIDLVSARPRQIVAYCNVDPTERRSEYDQYDTPDHDDDRDMADRPERDPEQHDITAWCARCKTTRQTTAELAQHTELAHTLRVCPCIECRRTGSIARTSLDYLWSAYHRDRHHVYELDWVLRRSQDLTG